MTTAIHPMILSAERVIREAADLLEGEGFSRKKGAAYGVPEAVKEAAGEDNLARVLAERVLVRAGIDVWWSDLLCIDGDDAAANLRATLPIAEDIYGPMTETILGLLKAASMMSADQLNGIGNMLIGRHYSLFNDCQNLADSIGRGALFAQVTEDVHFATAHYASTPAAVQRRLKGVRGLECVGAFYVLNDQLSMDDARLLVGPVSAILFPLQSFMR